MKSLLKGSLLALCVASPLFATHTPSKSELEAYQARFAHVELSADISQFPENEKAALAKMIEAAQIMNTLFLRQDWAGSEIMLQSLLQDHSPLGLARMGFFLFMKGPWNRQDGNKVFIPGAPEKPEEANFYPAGATKSELETWFKTLPPSERDQATGFYTVIRRTPEGKLLTIPYSVEYQSELAIAAKLLNEAADLTQQATLKNFLTKRAKAFLSNDYYESEIAWMELDASIEPTIGPYENYEDAWFTNKAAFEAFITVRDDAETAKLQKFSSQLQWLEDRLPIDPAYRNPKLGALSPIRVVNQVYASGDAQHGVATAAFNLPNDERVTKEKGAKRTMLKNVQEAKFDVVLLPLTKIALAKKDWEHVQFDAFFTHILMHELMHGLGPHEVKGADGKTTTVRQALQELFSAVEEAKADISGLWALQQLIDKGVLDKKLEGSIYATFLASAFRTLRFGISEAHGRGMALQLNYLLDHGGFVVNKDGSFAVDDKHIKKAVEGLTREIMELQARGDYAGTKALLEKYGSIRPAVAALLKKAEHLPVDIASRHKTAELLLGRSL